MSDEPQPHAVLFMDQLQRGEVLRIPMVDITGLTAYEAAALTKVAKKRGYICELSPSELLFTFYVPGTA